LFNFNQEAPTKPTQAPSQNVVYVLQLFSRSQSRFYQAFMDEEVQSPQLNWLIATLCAAASEAIALNTPREQPSHFTPDTG
jgi:hypothetical protein